MMSISSKWCLNLLKTIKEKPGRYRYSWRVELQCGKDELVAKEERARCMAGHASATQGKPRSAAMCRAWPVAKHSNVQSKACHTSTSYSAQQRAAQCLYNRQQHAAMRQASRQQCVMQCPSRELQVQAWFDKNKRSKLSKQVQGRDPRPKCVECSDRIQECSSRTQECSAHVES